MEGSRFDAWTRRRFGLAAGGAAGSILGLAALHDADAKRRRKRKKKRCKNLGDGCTPGGKRKCCSGLECGEILVAGLGTSPFFCCKGIGQTCATPSECCSAICLDDECQPVICKELGQICSASTQCCSGICLDNECQPTTCKTLGQTCSASNQCCSGFCDTVTDFKCEASPPI